MESGLIFYFITGRESPSMIQGLHRTGKMILLK